MHVFAYEAFDGTLETHCGGQILQVVGSENPQGTFDRRTIYAKCDSQDQDDVNAREVPQNCATDHTGGSASWPLVYTSTGDGHDTSLNSIDASSHLDPSLSSTGITLVTVPIPGQFEATSGLPLRYLKICGTGGGTCYAAHQYVGDTNAFGFGGLFVPGWPVFGGDGVPIATACALPPTPPPDPPPSPPATPPQLPPAPPISDDVTLNRSPNVAYTNQMYKGDILDAKTDIYGFVSGQWSGPFTSPVARDRVGNIVVENDDMHFAHVISRYATYGDMWNVAHGDPNGWQIGMNGDKWDEVTQTPDGADGRDDTWWVGCGNLEKYVLSHGRTMVKIVFCGTTEDAGEKPWTHNNCVMQYIRPALKNPTGHERYTFCEMLNSLDKFEFSMDTRRWFSPGSEYYLTYKTQDNPTHLVRAGQTGDVVDNGVEYDWWSYHFCVDKNTHGDCSEWHNLGYRNDAGQKHGTITLPLNAGGNTPTGCTTCQVTAVYDDGNWAKPMVQPVAKQDLNGDGVVGDFEHDPYVLRYHAPIAWTVILDNCNSPSSGTACSISDAGKMGGWGFNSFDAENGNGYFKRAYDMYLHNPSVSGATFRNACYKKYENKKSLNMDVSHDDNGDRSKSAGWAWTGDDGRPFEQVPGGSSPWWNVGHDMIGWQGSASQGSNSWKKASLCRDYDPRMDLTDEGVLKIGTARDCLDSMHNVPYLGTLSLHAAGCNTGSLSSGLCGDGGTPEGQYKTDAQWTTSDIKGNTAGYVPNSCGKDWIDGLLTGSSAFSTDANVGPMSTVPGTYTVDWGLPFIRLSTDARSSNFGAAMGYTPRKFTGFQTQGHGGNNEAATAYHVRICQHGQQTVRDGIWDGLTGDRPSLYGEGPSLDAAEGAVDCMWVDADADGNPRKFVDVLADGTVRTSGASQRNEIVVHTFNVPLYGSRIEVFPVEYDTWPSFRMHPYTVNECGPERCVRECAFHNSENPDYCRGFEYKKTFNGLGASNRYGNCIFKSTSTDTTGDGNPNNLQSDSVGDTSDYYEIVPCDEVYTVSSFTSSVLGSDVPISSPSRPPLVESTEPVVVNATYERTDRRDRHSVMEVRVRVSDTANLVLNGAPASLILTIGDAWSSAPDTPPPARAGELFDDGATCGDSRAADGVYTTIGGCDDSSVPALAHSVDSDQILSGGLGNRLPVGTSCLKLALENGSGRRDLHADASRPYDCFDVHETHAKKFIYEFELSVGADASGTTLQLAKTNAPTATNPHCGNFFKMDHSALKNPLQSPTGLVAAPWHSEDNCCSMCAGNPDCAGFSFDNGCVFQSAAGAVAEGFVRQTGTTVYYVAKDLSRAIYDGYTSGLVSYNVKCSTCASNTVFIAAIGTGAGTVRATLKDGCDAETDGDCANASCDGSACNGVYSGFYSRDGFAKAYTDTGGLELRIRAEGETDFFIDNVTEVRANQTTIVEFEVSNDGGAWTVLSRTDTFVPIPDIFPLYGAAVSTAVAAAAAARAAAAPGPAPTPTPARRRAETPEAQEAPPHEPVSNSLMRHLGKLMSSLGAFAAAK